MNKFLEIIKLLLDMVFSLKFLGTVATVLILYSMGKVDLAVYAIIGYVGIKAISTANTVRKEGEFEYKFVSNEKLNMIICWVFSTKTWLTITGGFLLLKASNVVIMMPQFLQFQFVPEVCPVGQVCALPLITWEQAKLFGYELGIALVAAVGIPELTAYLKGVDLGTIKLTSKPSLFIPAGAVPEVSSTPGPVAVVKPTSDYKPLDVVEWDRQVEKVAKEVHLEVTPVTLYRSTWNVAQKTRCLYVDNLISFGYFYLDKAKQMFRAQFPFSYDDRNKPEVLSTLRDQCGKTPVTFKQFISQDPLLSSVVVDEVERIEVNLPWVEKLTEKRQQVENKLRAAPVNGYNYNDTFWNAKELYENS